MFGKGLTKQALVFMGLQYKSFVNTVEKGEIGHNEQFLLFQHFHPTFSSNSKLSAANSFSLEESEICRLGKGQPLPKRQILDSSKLKQFADNNCKFDKTGIKSIQMGRKRCGKRRNCSIRAISPFPTVFSSDMYCRHVKTRACLGKS